MKLSLNLAALIWVGTLALTAAEQCASPGLKRIVGYYEGQSMRRSCDVFSPERIIDGVITHVIFAHADIDPETFEVRPAHDYDPPLYRRLSLLKFRTPGMRMYIGLGGSTLNGPQNTAFSDIARSSENQAKFVRSLISFMETHGFDGVDIDWERPGDGSYGGREEDRENYPTWLRNLRKHLAVTGRGLSIAASVSPHRSRNFDFRRLSDNVDFINLKSYDLQSVVDFPEHWDGSSMSAHTNLTEIKSAVDLILRDDVPSSKLVLGLALYGRGYIPASTRCLEPGCEYASVLPFNRCTQETGEVLFFGEINKTLDLVQGDPGTRIVHHEDDAVKILSWGEESKQWLAYDDQETLLAKAKYAHDKCLSGVGLWALTRDTLESDLAEALRGVSPILVRPDMPPMEEMRKDGEIRDKYEANLALYKSQVREYMDNIVPARPEDMDMDGMECLSGKMHTVQAGESCDTLASEHSFASADLVRGNSRLISRCDDLKPGMELCLPQSCEHVHVVKEGDTCHSIPVPRRAGGVTFGTVQLLNNWIDFECENLVSASDEKFGHVICLSPRGGETKVKAGRSVEKQRGVAYVPPPQDAPIAPGTPPRCAGWHIAEKGETCPMLTLYHSITIDQLFEVNPSLGETFDGCTEKIVEGYGYCVLPLWGWKMQMERMRENDEL